MTYRSFPNQVAVYNERFVFTTLSSLHLVSSKGSWTYAHPETGKPCKLFSLDQNMRYVPFAQDYGPLNQAYTLEACWAIHSRLKVATDERPVGLYTSEDPKQKSNIALVVALYFVIVGGAEPCDAFRPIAEMEIRPFRDAGSSIMEWGLHIQDCLMGVRKAIDFGLMDFLDMDLEEYRYFETVANGDFNVLGPFIPFASPVEPDWMEKAIITTKLSDGTASREIKVVEKARFRTLSHAFRCVLQKFRREKVGLVVRLNDEQYDKRHFETIGISHVEMYFDDGSNPSDDIVRTFIQMADKVIEGKKGKVAVHCKAGLGRTGILIGAYFIYKYGFSAQEVIGFMRIVRPGMVVGTQQQYMVGNQMKWIGWAARDALLRELTAERGSLSLPTPPLEHDVLLPCSSPRPSRPATPPMPSSPPRIARSPAIRSGSKPNKTLVKGGDAAGQPRKTPGPIRGEVYEYVEIDMQILEASETNEVDLSRSRVTVDSYREITVVSSVPTSPTTEHSRGIKRGSERTPLSRNLSAESSSLGSLQTPHSSTRPSSVTSVNSGTGDADGRPSKRRPYTSQNGSTLMSHVLSSPPPSRESSPEADVEFVSERRSGESPLLSPREPIGPASPHNQHSVLHPVTVIPHSKLPSRKAVPQVKSHQTHTSSSSLKKALPVVKDEKTTSSDRASGKDRIGRPSTLEARITKSASPQRILAREKEKETTRRDMTPPRFGFSILGRKGSNGE